MPLSSTQLQAFAEVAKTLNFTHAAKRLLLTQSALSQRIAKLEDELETTLFVRDRGSIRLTIAGESLLRFYQVKESAEEELLAELKSSGESLRGTLRIGGTSSINRSLLIPALKGFLQKHPTLSFGMMTRELADLPDLLRRSEVDYLVTTVESDSADVENLFLGFEDSVLVKAKGSNDSQILLDHDEADKTTQEYFRRNRLPVPKGPRRFLDDVYGLIDGVRAGIGQAVLPLHLVADERGLEIVHPTRRLTDKVFLQHYRLPYYRQLHATVIAEISRHFRQKLRQ